MADDPRAQLLALKEAQGMSEEVYQAALRLLPGPAGEAATEPEPAEQLQEWPGIGAQVPANDVGITILQRCRAALASCLPSVLRLRPHRQLATGGQPRARASRLRCVALPAAVAVRRVSCLQTSSAWTPSS